MGNNSFPSYFPPMLLLFKDFLFLSSRFLLIFITACSTTYFFVLPPPSPPMLGSKHSLQTRLLPFAAWRRLTPHPALVCLAGWFLECGEGPTGMLPAASGDPLENERPFNFTDAELITHLDYSPLASSQAGCSYAASSGEKCAEVAEVGPCWKQSQ